MVDDKQSLCFAMREYFKLYGYQVDCAYDLENAAALLYTFRYKCVIADLDLGGTHNMDGLKVIKMTREQFPATPIIVLTAYGASEVESVVRGSGASAFLHKPKPLSEVARIVLELVGDNPSVHQK